MRLDTSSTPFLPPKSKAPETLGISGAWQGDLERAMGIEPSIQLVDCTRLTATKRMQLYPILYQSSRLGNSPELALPEGLMRKFVEALELGTRA